jgi:hypothetical protein
MNDETSAYIVVKKTGSGKVTLYDCPKFDTLDDCTPTCSAFNFYNSNSDFRGLKCTDGDFDDEAESMKVGYGVMAIVYNDFDFQGTAAFFFQNVDDFSAYGPTGLHQNISSIKVISGVGCPNRDECPGCGDQSCNGTETPDSCPSDCFCGDKVCNGTETHASCPSDCP